ncbi:exodeoxyribonuclease VII large subunit [Candidatus Saccharibacteria bacterium]|nr:exodeoxyribonuclease VII large subunit [Candidatus Saccharibacteria bacterium]
MENSFTPTEFVAVVNQTLEYAYSSVVLTGEVASFKVNQGKWVFFDLKDEETSIGCFMALWSLRVPLEDGMKVAVRGVPKLTKWGKFSFTVTGVQLVGEGSLKKAYEMLKKKLTAEGLFDPAKKRPLPKDLTRLGVISSVQAAGYADFIKIINARWGGIKVQVAHTQVQGMEAADQMIRALRYFNERGEVQVIALLRGGGSADDLACFNDEQLVREVAASRIPVITGVGHEVDESLCDLAADVRASTPSNAAEMLTPDKKVVRARITDNMVKTAAVIYGAVEAARAGVRDNVVRAALAAKNAVQGQIDGIEEKMALAGQDILAKIDAMQEKIAQQQKVLVVLNPEKVLKQGYAIIGGRMDIGDVVKITTFNRIAEAEIKNITERKI